MALEAFDAASAGLRTRLKTSVGAVSRAGAAGSVVFTWTPNIMSGSPVVAAFNTATASTLVPVTRALPGMLTGAAGKNASVTGVEAVVVAVMAPPGAFTLVSSVPLR